MRIYSGCFVHDLSLFTKRVRMNGVRCKDQMISICVFGVFLV